MALVRSLSYRGPETRRRAGGRAPGPDEGVAMTFWGADVDGLISMGVRCRTAGGRLADLQAFASKWQASQDKKKA